MVARSASADQTKESAKSASRRDRTLLIVTSEDLKRSRGAKSPLPDDGVQFWCSELVLDPKVLKRAVEQGIYNIRGPLSSSEIEKTAEGQTVVIADAGSLSSVGCRARPAQSFHLLEWMEVSGQGKYRMLSEAVSSIYGIDVASVGNPSVCLIEVVHEMISTMLDDDAKKTDGNRYADFVAARAAGAEKTPADVPAAMPVPSREQERVSEAEKDSPKKRPESGKRVEVPGEETGDVKSSFVERWKTIDPGIKLVTLGVAIERAYLDILGGRDLTSCPDRDLEILRLVSELAADVGRMVLMDPVMHAIAFEQKHVDALVRRTSGNAAFDVLLARKMAEGPANGG